MSDVIYEVSLSVTPNRVSEFDAWLSDHIDEMLDLPGFIDAHTFHGQRDDGQPIRCVHYRLRDEQSLEQYFEDHAPRMRAQGVAKFGDDMQSERRVLSEHMRRSTQRCMNCDAPLGGQYCTQCGQRHRARMISVWELLRDVLDDLLSWDSRLWRSLRPLLFAPGRLTNEYLQGRRTYYTPPMRMYLVLSIVFFLLSTLPSLSDLNAESLLSVDDDVPGMTLQIGDTVIEGGNEQAESQSQGEDGEAKTPEEKCTLDDLELDVPGIDEELLRKKIQAVCIAMQTARGRAQLADEFVDLVPTLLIIMLPLIALASKILYPFSRRYYVEHLLFYTHYQSFVFFMLIVLMGIGAVMGRVDFLSGMVQVAEVAAGLYAVYYLFRALRVVFGQGRFFTLVKMTAISFVYIVGAAFLGLIGLAIAALSVG